MKVVLDRPAIKPYRAHKKDAGLDLRATEDFLVPSHGHKTVDTGMHVQLPKHTAGLLVSKSGLNVKHHIVSTGLIDEGYTGSIKVKLYNHGRMDYFGKKGDKISQLVIIPVLRPKIKYVKTLKGTDRGDNGFGSSGR